MSGGIGPHGGVAAETVATANGGAAHTVGSTSIEAITLNAATCALTFPSAVAGRSFTLQLTQDASGGRGVTWPTVKWPGGAAPQLTATANAVDLVSFMCINGTDWLGFPSGYDLR